MICLDWPHFLQTKWTCFGKLPFVFATRRMYGVTSFLPSTNSEAPTGGHVEPLSTPKQRPTHQARSSCSSPRALAPLAVAG